MVTLQQLAVEVLSAIVAAAVAAAVLTALIALLQYKIFK